MVKPRPVCRPMTLPLASSFPESAATPLTAEVAVTSPPEKLMSRDLLISTSELKAKVDFVAV